MKTYVLTFLDGRTETIEADVCVETSHLIKFMLGRESDGTIVTMVHQSVIKSVFVKPSLDDAVEAELHSGCYVTERRMGWQQN